MSLYDGYLPSLETLTNEQFPWRVFPASVNALVLVGKIVAALLVVDTIRRLAELKRVICYCRAQRSVVRISGVGAFASDVRELNVNHLSKVLTLNADEKPRPLRRIVMKNWIDGHSVRARYVTPAARSSIAPDPSYWTIRFNAHLDDADVECRAIWNVKLSDLSNLIVSVNDKYCKEFGSTKLRWSAKARYLWYTMSNWLKKRHAPSQEHPIITNLLTPTDQGPSSNRIEPLLPTSLLQSITSALPPGKEVRLTPDANNLTLQVPANTNANQRNSTIQLVLICLRQNLQILCLDDYSPTSGKFDTLWNIVVEGSCGGALLQMAIFGLGEGAERECLICLNASKDSILLPCRHCAACVRCLRGLVQDRCPICRSRFDGFIQVPWRS